MGNQSGYRSGMLILVLFILLVIISRGSRTRYGVYGNNVANNNVADNNNSANNNNVANNNEGNNVGNNLSNLGLPF